MKISVIIPTYNEQEVIIDCLESLDKQTLKDFEVIIVDDGSTDNTFSFISHFNPLNYTLKIYKQSHLGAGEARNLGAQKSKGAILVFIDADMTFDKAFLEKLVHPIRQGISKGTFSKQEYVSNWQNVWAKCWNINLNLDSKRRLPKEYPDTQKVFRAVLKSEFDKVKGFSKGGYTDDWSLSEKLGFLATNAKGAVFYHKNPESLIEIFHQAKWSAKRTYKLGILGSAIAIVRANILFSLLIGIYKAFRYKIPQFIVFKVIYDMGITIGVLEYFITNKGSK